MSEGGPNVLGGLARFLALSVVFSAIFYFFGPHLAPLGHLPGDITVKGAKGTYTVPITSCILLTIALNIVLRLWAKLRR